MPHTRTFVLRTFFFSLEAVDCNGNEVDFKQLAGNVTIVLNISDASNQTPQNINNIKEICNLYEEYHERGLEIIAFPSEHRTDSRKATPRNINAWLMKNSINFHVMHSIDVNGALQHPVYSFLKQEGADIRGPFHTAFIVACIGDRCTIQRLDGKPPRALRSYVEELLLRGDID